MNIANEEDNKTGKVPFYITNSSRKNLAFFYQLPIETIVLMYILFKHLNPNLSQKLYVLESSNAVKKQQPVLKTFMNSGRQLLQFTLKEHKFTQQKY